MKVFNPFMPYKYIYPRASGLIAYKGGGASAADVNSSVAGGVSSVNANTNAGFASNKTFNQGLANSLDTKMDGVQGSVDGLGGKITTVGGDVTEGFSSLNEYLKGQFDAATTDRTSNAATINTGITDLGTANQASFDKLGGDVTQGFSDMNTGFADQDLRFDTLDTSVGTVQDSVDTGFTEAKGQLDEQTKQNTKNFGEMGEQFTLAGEAMNKGFSNASTELTETQRQVLEGQGGLVSDLSDLSSSADIYAQQSLDNQEALKQDQDSFRTSFDDYVNRYGEDQRLATISRADLAAAQANQTDALRNDLGKYSDIVSRGQDALSQDIENNTQGIQSDITRGFAGLGAGQTRNTNNITGQLSDIETFQISQTKKLAEIATRDESIDPQMRGRFAELSGAFDDSGSLIRNSVDSRGNTFARSMDQNGNLLVTSYDPTGNRLGDSQINIQATLQDLDGLVGAALKSPYQSTG